MSDNKFDDMFRYGPGDVENIHALLSTIGMIPIFGLLFDTLNAAVYSAEGNFADAAFSLAANLPFGDLIKGTKLGTGIGKPIAKGVAKGAKRDELLNSVQNDKLKKAINEIYRPDAAIGDGGLADAVRHELSTGTLTSGKSHIQKAKERITNLENIVKQQSLSQTDIEIANKLLNDLKNALGGK